MCVARLFPAQIPFVRLWPPLAIDYLAAAYPRINDGVSSWHANGRT